MPKFHYSNRVCNQVLSRKKVVDLLSNFYCSNPDLDVVVDQVGITEFGHYHVISKNCIHSFIH